MTWMETRSASEHEKIRRIKEITEWVMVQLAKHYKQIRITTARGDEEICFLLNDGTLAHVEYMYGGKFNDIVIEYADSIEDRKKMNTEDGDLFPVDEPSIFSTPKDMVDAILSEMKHIGG